MKMNSIKKRRSFNKNLKKSNRYKIVNKSNCFLHFKKKVLKLQKAKKIKNK